VTQRLRIAVADDEPLVREFMQDALERLGYDVVASAANGRELVERCRTLQPDLVITDIKMPEMDGLEAASEIYRDRPIPIVVVTAYHDAPFVQRAEENQVLAYMVKPVKETDLAPAITIAMRRFEQFQELREETDNLRQALEDRKTIERAKGILMKQAHLDEDAAFRRLQKLARSNSKKLIEVAKMIVVTAQALEPHGDD
jgi:two-component system, response regulator PdtaR